MEGIQIYLSSFHEKPLQIFKSYPHFKDSEVNILGSYGTADSDYHQVLYEQPDLFNDAILDSGAFTINNPNNKSVNRRLTFDGFKAYCRATKERFKFIINYDEDFTTNGFEKNDENLKDLEKAGISAIPVIHDYEAENFDEIDHYLRHGYDLIALGYAENKKAKVKKAVRRITRHGSKVHVLGITSYNDLKDLPVLYCDSSSWIQAVAFGRIYFWNGNDNKRNPLVDDMTDKIRFWDKDEQDRKPGYYYDDYPFKSDLDDYLKEMFGFTWVDLYGPDKNVNREVVNIHYHVILQQKLREYHKRNPQIFRPYNFAVGVKKDGMSAISRNMRNGN
jgi:hypothetical protein